MASRRRSMGRRPPVARHVTSQMLPATGLAQSMEQIRWRRQRGPVSIEGNDGWTPLHPKAPVDLQLPLMAHNQERFGMGYFKGIPPPTLPLWYPPPPPPRKYQPAPLLSLHGTPRCFL